MYFEEGIEEGYVTQVVLVEYGSYLTADHAAGASVLSVEDASDFESDGGSLLLNGQVYAYSSVDYEADTITLTGTLSAAASEDDRVDLSPAVMEKVAVVLIEDQGDTINARIPASLYEKFTIGDRSESEREAVTLVLEGTRWVIDDMPGIEPVIDGSYIDPTTLPSEAPTAPPSSPTPQVIGSVGALFVRWDPIDNPTPFNVEVHISTTQGFTPTLNDPATLAGTSVNGTGLTIRSMPNDTPLEYTYDDGTGNMQTRVYYIRTIAYNDAGTAAVSAEASGSMIPVTSSDIAANQAWVGTMDVTQLTGGTLDAEIIIGEGVIRAKGANGAKVEMDGMGFRVVDNEGDTLVNFPTDDQDKNVFVTAIDATNLTVNDAFIEAGSLAGTFTLLNAVPDPNAAPTVSSTYDVQNTDLQTPTAPAGNDWKYRIPGGCWSDGTYLYWIARTNSGDLYYWLIKAPLDGSSTGVARAQINTVNNDGDPDYRPYGVVGIGSTLYVPCRYRPDKSLVVKKFDKSTMNELTAQGFASFTFGTTCPSIYQSGHQMACATDGTYIYVAYAEKSTYELRIRKYTTTGTLLSTFSAPNYHFGAANVGYYPLSLLVGSFDFGSTRYILNSGQEVAVFTESSGTLTNQVSEWWDLPYTANSGMWSDYDNAYGTAGLWWDGTRFNSLATGNATHTTVVTRKYSTILDGEDHGEGTWSTLDARFSYSWYDTVNGYESVPSPRGSVTLKRRGWWTLTVPSPPAAVSNAGVRVYLGTVFGTGTSPNEPFNQDMYLQTTLTGGTTSIVSESATFSGTNPQTSSTFTTQTPGLIQSQELNPLDGDPAVYIGGDGTANFTKALFRSTTDVNTSSGNEPPVRIGDITGNHMRMDGNEIMSMAGPSTQGEIGIQGRFFTSWDFGTTTVTVSGGSGVGTFSHQCGAVPELVLVTNKQNGQNIIWTVTSGSTSTLIEVRGVTAASGNAVANGTYNIAFLAIHR